MNPTFAAFLWPMVWTIGGLVVLVSLVSLLARVGSSRVVGVMTRAPMLDLIVALLTWVPWVVGGVLSGWMGLAGAFVGQFVFAHAWSAVHEALHREAARGPRIVKVLNRIVGRWRNHLALWVTVIALPVFWIVRLNQVIAYPLLVWILDFPRYRHSDWINVSRQKFVGLVGHDLLWCLYCDWMTGVYALGGEMLRNVESFWCPIRFYEGKKCANCRVDFPDIDNGWVPATGTMQQVADTLDRHYADGQRTWFGHPARLTIEGRPLEESSPAPTETAAP